MWGHLKTLVYAAPVVNEDVLTVALWMPVKIRNYPGIFERMLWSMMRRVEAGIEFHVRYVVHLL
jgi:hypothetical protein